MELQPGDTLVLCTDGITKAKREGCYGRQRLARAALRSAGHAAQAVRGANLEDMRRFGHGAAQADDAVLMVWVRDSIPRNPSLRGVGVLAPRNDGLVVVSYERRML